LKNTGPRGNYLSVSLTGTTSNRSAIGARVTLEAAGHRQTDVVMSGGSYYSQNDLTLYFGLGTAKTVDRLEVRWPSGKVEHWTQVPANQRLRITEGQRATTGAVPPSK